MHWYGGIIRAYYWFPLKVPNQAYWTKTSYYHLENVLSCFNLSGVFCSSSMSSTRSTDVRLSPSIISIRSSANTSWPGVAYNVVWYVIFTAKSVATRRPYQGFPHLGNYFQTKCMYEVCYELEIFFDVEFACGFSIVAHLEIIPHSFPIRLF